MGLGGINSNLDGESSSSVYIGNQFQMEYNNTNKAHIIEISICGNMIKGRKLLAFGKEKRTSDLVCFKDRASRVAPQALSSDTAEA